MQREQPRDVGGVAGIRRIILRKLEKTNESQSVGRIEPGRIQKEKYKEGRKSDRIDVERNDRLTAWYPERLGYDPCLDNRSSTRRRLLRWSCLYVQPGTWQLGD